MTALSSLISLTLRDPAAALARLRALGVGTREAWQAIMLASATGAILSWLALRMLPASESGGLFALAGAPIVMATLQLGAAALFATLLARVGRMFGGTGSFADALRATAWIEILMLLAQIPQLLLAVILPGLGGIVGMLTFGLYLYLTVLLTRAVHGFRSPVMVALGIIGTVMVTGFALSVIAAALGILPEVPA